MGKVIFLRVQPINSPANKKHLPPTRVGASKRQVPQSFVSHDGFAQRPRAVIFASPTKRAKTSGRTRDTNESNSHYSAKDEKNKRACA